MFSPQNNENYIMIYIINKHNDHAGRDYDMEELEKLESSGYGDMKRMANKVARRIRNENSRVRSMRESLIKAHRNKDAEEVKDIHEFIKGKSGYQND